MKTQCHQHIAYACTDVCIAYSVVENMLSAIAHQMWRSQVLPGYPHSSAGAYAAVWQEQGGGILLNSPEASEVETALQLHSYLWRQSDPVYICTECTIMNQQDSYIYIF